mmetsp:Transcript_120460/g.341315  ORF Transcript_120460/g.341315 Transcript_120460/m.341315 type:complete len:216 (+) Transcript_120460:1333-1980(+)
MDRDRGRDAPPLLHGDGADAPEPVFPPPQLPAFPPAGTPDAVRGRPPPHAGREGGRGHLHTPADEVPAGAGQVRHLHPAVHPERDVREQHHLPGAHTHHHLSRDRALGRRDRPRRQGRGHALELRVGLLVRLGDQHARDRGPPGRHRPQHAPLLGALLRPQALDRPAQPEARHLRAGPRERGGLRHPRALLHAADHRRAVAAHGVPVHLLDEGSV